MGERAGVHVCKRMRVVLENKTALRYLPQFAGFDPANQCIYLEIEKKTDNPFLTYYLC